MAETVGQHAVAAFTSPVNGSTPIDANTVRGNDNTIRVAYVDHDADPGIHVQSSALASRPIAGVAGRKWMTVDGTVTRLWYDTGSTWLEMQAGTLSTARTLWGQSFDGTANVSGNLSSVGNIAMTGALSGATSLSATSVSATNVTGTLQTAAQPNVTSVGTLGSLAVSGNGVLQTINGSASAFTDYGIGGVSQARVGTQNFATGDLSLLTLTAAPVVFGTNNAERMRIDASGNLGIGTTSPAYKLSVFGAIEVRNANAVHWRDSSNTSFASIFNNTGAMVFETSFTERARIDSSGNLGLGVTPSAWASGWRALEQANGSLVSNAGATLYKTQNAHFNGSNWIYKTTNPASFYAQGVGIHSWHTAPSGTAGNTISFTQAMTLDASGILLLGLTSSNNAIFDAYSAANGIARIRGGSGTNQGGAFFVSNSAGTQTLAAFGDTARMLGGTPDASVTMFAGNVPLAFYVNAAERARIKAEGQFRFVPLSAAPTTNVENGDVYYDSTTNKLRVRAAGAWVDLH